jgi:hypothetical protein
MLLISAILNRTPPTCGFRGDICKYLKCGVLDCGRISERAPTNFCSQCWDQRKTRLFSTLKAKKCPLPRDQHGPSWRSEVQLNLSANSLVNNRPLFLSCSELIRIRIQHKQVFIPTNAVQRHSEANCIVSKVCFTKEESTLLKTSKS